MHFVLEKASIHDAGRSWGAPPDHKRMVLQTIKLVIPIAEVLLRGHAVQHAMSRGRDCVAVESGTALSTCSPEGSPTIEARRS